MSPWLSYGSACPGLPSARCVCWWVLPGHWSCLRPPPTGIPPMSLPVLWLSAAPADSRSCPCAQQGQCRNPPAALWGASRVSPPCLLCGTRQRGTSLGSRRRAGHACPGVRDVPGVTLGTSPWPRPMKEPLFSRRCWGSSGQSGRAGCWVLMAAQYLLSRDPWQGRAVPGYLSIKMCSRALLPWRACAGKDPGRSARPGMSQVFAGTGGDGAGTGIPGERPGGQPRSQLPLPAPIPSYPIPSRLRLQRISIHPSVSARGVGRGGSAESTALDAAPARRDEPRRSHGELAPR